MFDITIGSSAVRLFIYKGEYDDETQQAVYHDRFFHRYGFRLNFDYMRACSLFCFQDSFIHTHTHTHLDRWSTSSSLPHSPLKQHWWGSWRKGRGAPDWSSSSIIITTQYLLLNASFSGNFHPFPSFCYLSPARFSVPFVVFLFFPRRKLRLIHLVIPQMIRKSLSFCGDRSMRAGVFLHGEILYV